MKYVFQFGRILLFCFLGELLHMILPLPIPASIYGLILLLAALLTGIVKLEQVQDTGKYLVLIFPIMFVPAAAGVMDLWEEISAILIPIILATVVVTALVIGAAGKVTELMIRRTSGGTISAVAGGSTGLEKMSEEVKDQLNEVTKEKVTGNDLDGNEGKEGAAHE